MGGRRWADTFESTRGNSPKTQEWVEVCDVAVMRETERALLVSVGTGDGERDMWIPKTQIAEHSPVRGGIDCGVLIISKWIAEQKNLA